MQVKKLLSATICGLACLTTVLVDQASAAMIVFTSDFDSIADTTGDFSFDGGAGNLDKAGTTSLTNGELLINSDGGSDRLEFESVPSAAVVVGQFTFDVSYEQQDPNVAPTSPTLFFQAVDGNARSTGGSPQPNFSDSIGSASLASPSTLNYFFNADPNGSPITYIGPDGSTNTLAPGTYDFWNDLTLTDAGQTQSGNGATTPVDGVDTLVLQTFGGASGSRFIIDNVTFKDIAVPEPSSAAVLAFASLGMLVCWRRK